MSWVEFFRRVDVGLPSSQWLEPKQYVCYARAVAEAPWLTC